jgi:hypothetical protein
MKLRHQVSIIVFIFIIFNSYYYSKKKSATIKFNSGSQSISDKTILQNLLNKHVFLHAYFCDNKLKDNLQESICKYDLNKFSNFKNYKEAETMINILYKVNSNICNNILEFYDINKKTINLHEIVLYCDEFQMNYVVNPHLNYIYKILIFCINLLMIISSYLFAYENIQININNRNKKKEKKIILKDIINKINYTNELDICSICHDSYTNDSIDISELKSCKHIYHYECIKLWLVTHKHTKCPFCNKEVYQQNY